MLSGDESRMRQLAWSALGSKQSPLFLGCFSCTCIPTRKCEDGKGLTNSRHFYAGVKPTQNQFRVTDNSPITFVEQTAFRHAPPEKCAASERAKMTSDNVRAQGQNNPAVT